MKYRKFSNICRSSIQSLENRVLLTGSLTLAPFEDLNYDGIRQSSEKAMTIDYEFHIHSGTPDNLGGEQVLYVPTGGTASISLTAGTYTIDSPTIHNQNRFITGTTDDQLVITLVDGQSKTLGIAIATLIQVSRQFFFDFDGDGKLGPADQEASGVHAFFDDNNNGVFDAGEPEWGNSSFGVSAVGGLRPGVRHLVVDSLLHWKSTAIDIDPTVYSGTPPLVPLVLNRQGLSIAGAVRSYDPLPDFYRYNDIEYAGQVYLDLNQNKQLDPGEPAQNLAAGNDGYFLFNNLTAGTYSVRLNLPAGASQTYPHANAAINVTVGATSPNGVALFGAGPTTSKASVEVPGFWDSDGDGVLTSRDGVTSGQGTIFYADLNGNGSWDSSTEPGGYGIPIGSMTAIYLDPGQYTIRMVLPTGSKATTPSIFHVDLVAGERVRMPDVGYTFGNFLSGYVFSDNSFQGTNANMPGLANRTVYLDENNNGQLDAGEQQTTTDSSGNYRFDQIPNGTKTVRVVINADEIQTSPLDGGYTEQFRIGEVVNSDNKFGIAKKSGINTAKGSYEGTVYWDVNQDNVRDQGEGPYADLGFFADLNNNDAEDPSEPWTYTDPNGRLAFYNLPTGPITIRSMSEPTIVFNGGTRSFTFNSVAGQHQTGVNIGVVWNQPTGGVAGTLYNDSNHNGIQDANELGIPNEPVALVANPDDLPTQMGWGYTDQLGHYFLPVPYLQYSYETEFTLPLGWDPGGDYVSRRYVRFNVTPGSITQGIDLGIADPAGASNGVVGAITEGSSGQTLVAAARTLRTAALTLAAAAPVTGSGLPSRTVWDDLNNNGKIDAGEPTTVTDSAGNFSFARLAVGTHNFRELLPAGWYQSSPANNSAITVTVDSASVVRGLQFDAYYASQPPQITTASISGAAFNDVNSDGAQQSGETGLAGVQIFLDTNDNGSADAGELTTTTAADGSFVFANLPAGPYRVRRVVPAGQVQTTALSNVILVAGQASSGILIGTAPAATSSIVLQAEAAVLIGGTFSSTAHANFTGAGFADYGGNGSAIQWTASNMTAGSSTLTFRYSNGSGSARPLTVIVNGVTIGTVACAPTTNWDTWATVSISATLLAGTNTIKAVAGATTGGNVDSLTITSASALPAPSASIGGFLFNDLDGDGLYDHADTKAAGQKVFLDTDSSGTLNGSEVSVLTDANGNWSFTGLAAGTYHVREVIPAGYTASTALIDAALADGQALTGQSFGVKAIPVTPPNDPASVTLEAEDATLTGGTYKQTNHANFTGTGFADYGGNGSAAQWNITRTAAGAATLTFRYANGSGSARPLSVVINGVAVGSVACAPTASWDTWGTVSIDVNLVSGTNTIKAIAGAVTGGNVDSLTITSATTPPPTPTGSISGIAFNDADSDGVFNHSDTLAAGQTVFLDLNGNGTLDAGESSVITGPNGAFSFAALPAGAYHVREVLPSGYAFSTTPIDLNLADGQALSALNIGTQLLPITPPTSVTLEAEDGLLTGGTWKQANHANFTGTGFADFGGDGSAAQWSITRASGGQATLTFRYANGGSVDRPLSIFVNGVVVGSVACKSTGSWDTWSTVTINVALLSGSNTIKAIAGAATGGNADSVTIS